MPPTPAATATAVLYQVASGQAVGCGDSGSPPPPPPPAQSITLSALGGLSATAGGASLNFSAQVANATGLPLNFALETVSGPTAAPTPSSSTWSLGDLNKAVSATWAAAGTSVIRVRDANNALSNSLSVTVAAAPTPAPPPPAPAPSPAPTGNITQYLTSDGGSASYTNNFSGPTRDYWHRRMGFAWKRTNTAGNWLDSAQTQEGGTPYGSSASITSTGQALVITATALVSRWLTTGQNRGAYLRSRTGLSAFPVSFYGRTDATTANRPKLTVVTSTGTFVLTAAANAYWYNSTFTANGAASEWVLSANAAFAILRFDLSSVTGTLTSALLSITTKAFPSGGSTGQVVDLFEADPPTISDPVTVGSPVLGVLDGYANFSTYKASANAAILLADDFETGGPFDTGFTPAATRTLNTATGTIYARGQISTGANGSCDINKSISTGTGTGGAPNVVRDELFGQYSLYLESNFGTTQDDAIKIPAMGVQFGYWASGGYWQQTTGNGGNVGTGLKKAAFTPANSLGNFEYEGHSVRFLTGTEPSALDDDPYTGWFGIGIYPYNLDQVGPNPAGEPFPWVAIRKESWYTFDIRVKQNTMTGAQDGLGNYATANADGIYQVWINGQQVYSKNTFRWRKHAEFGVQGLWLDVYHGGTTTAPRDMNYRLDRVSIATSYIGPGLPSWVSGAAVNEWREIPGSAMSLAPPTVNPGPSSPANKIQAWNGLSIDTRRNEVWGPANGGHGDYWGNEVMKLALMSDAPAWVEMFPSSAASQVPGITAARYLDGNPASAHSYYGQQFMERHDRAIRVGGSYSGSGAGFDVVEGWDASGAQGVNGWDALGTYPPFNGVGGSQLQIDVPISKHPTTEALYLVQAENGAVRKFTPNASAPGGSWSTLGAAFVPFPSNGAASAIDTTRNRMLVTHGGNSAVAAVFVTPYTVDLTTGVWTAQAYPASAAKTQMDALKSSPGLVYVPQLDAYLLRAAGAGATVFKIDAATFAVSIISTTGGGSVPAGPLLDFSSVPAKSYENIYSRWLLAPGLRGVVYFPHYSSNGWFLRVY